MNLIRAEVLKLRTTSLWWVFALILLPLYGVALAYNWAISNAILSSGAAEIDTTGFFRVEQVITGFYTSGQFGGVLLVLLLSAILVTNEFFHLTATSTFLATPRRELVILAKMVVSVVIALVVWLVTTVLNLAFASLAAPSLGGETHLGESYVWQAIGLNGLVFVLWSLIGVGCGVLIRSQLGATLTLSIVYVVGTQIFTAVFLLLTNMVHESFQQLRVVIPTLAADLLVSGPQGPDDLPRWVGAVVMVAYAAAAGVLGTLITRRRDIG